MPSYETYQNAPITEALLDIRVTRPADISVESLEPFCDAVIAQYPTRRFRKEWRAEINVSDEGEPFAAGPAGNVVGVLLTSTDGNQIVQARINGFSFSRLRPYQDWATMRSEARRLWDLYLETVRPAFIERIALRYINRLELPLPFADFKQYVLTAPEIAPGLPQELSHFLMQLHIPSPSRDAMVIVTETIEKPEGDPAVLPFILDIDAISKQRLPANDSSLWERFETLHELKNEIFFESITDEAKELFK